MIRSVARYLAKKPVKARSDRVVARVKFAVVTQHLDKAVRI